MRLLTPQQVAERLNVSVRTVYRLVEKKQLWCYRISGKGTRIDELDLKAFLRSCYSKPIDHSRHERVNFGIPKGGDTGGTVSRADLVKEMRSWLQ